jgi:WD40 repeat protein
MQKPPFLIGILLGGLLLLSACAGLTPNRPPNVMIAASGHDVGKVLAVDPSSRQLASGGSEGMIRLWRLADGAPRGGWRAHPGGVHGLVFDAAGERLLSAGYDGRLVRWNLRGQPLQQVAGLPPVTAFAAAEGLVASGHRDGSLRWWRADSLELVTELQVHGGKVVALTLDPATRRVASSGADNRVALSHPDGSSQWLARPPTRARTLAFAPDPSQLYGGGWFRLYRWDTRGGALEVLDTEHQGIIQHIRFLQEPDQLASISRQTDSSVLILDPADGATRQFIGRHELCGDYVEVSPDGRYLVTTADDASIRIWDRTQLRDRVRR